MKTVVIILAVLVAALIVMSVTVDPQAAIQTSSAVTIPDEVKLGFTGVMIALWTAGLTYLFERTGLDLRSHAVPLAATIAVFLVGLAQNWINVLDPMYDPTVVLVLRILGALLSGIGVLRLVSRRPATLLSDGGGTVIDNR